MLSINWGQAGNVVFSGLVIVFIALILLIMLVYLMGWLISLKKSSKTADVPVPYVTELISAAPASFVSAAPSQGETVAAISAAVSAYMADSEPGTAYTITGITPVRAGRPNGTRPVWGFAGMRQNTEQF